MLMQPSLQLQMKVSYHNNLTLSYTILHFFYQDRDSKWISINQ